MLSQRSVTTPFALAGARALGASPVLTASVLSIGALHCALFGMRLLDRNSPKSRPSSALPRGLAFGCSSYGTGAGPPASSPRLLGRLLGLGRLGLG